MATSGQRDDQSRHDAHSVSNTRDGQIVEASVAELTLDENSLPTSDMEGRATEAEAVRRQVEHYFSASNLEKDTFLLSKMKGRKNLPIPLQSIAKFQKMQQFQPLSFVAESLQSSSTVDVVMQNGIYHVQRKEAFVMPDHLKAKNAQSIASGQGPLPVWKKATAASGFETYFTEGPLPPDVAAEEAEIYNDDNTFEERMEHAIRAYIARRKFNSTVSNYFTKWMKFGGVDSRPHAHVANSADPDELIGLTNREKKIATAPRPDLAGEQMDENGEPLWTVDFEGVAKAFLSTYVPEMFRFDRRDQYYELTNVMQNFLRYLQYHRVCPEHNTAINATIRICDQANRELPACETLQTNLPGAFNTAASTIFGGAFHDAFVGDQEWAQGESSEGIDISHGLSGKNARQLFAVGLISYEDLQPDHGKQIQQDQMMKQYIARREVGIGLEIVEVFPPTKEAIDLCAELKSTPEPLGRLICRPWKAKNFYIWDLPAGVSPDGSGEDNEKRYTFMLEETLLQNCHPGIKFDSVSVVTLEPCGIQILDGIPSYTRASFYEVLENELVLKWREPKFITREEQKEREEGLRSMREGPMPSDGEVGRSGGSGEASEIGADDEFN